jgi:hypothetical protein
MLVVAGGCAAALLGPACTSTTVDGGTGGSTGVAGGPGSGGARQGASSGGAAGDGSGGSGGATTGAGPVPGTCSQPFAAADAPGMYNVAMDAMPLSPNYWFLKLDDANDRCMLLYVVQYGEPACGVPASDGWAVEQVILTNSVADCQNPVSAPMGQTVQATCGTGSFTALYADEGVLAGGIVYAQFEFPPTYAWVPATDTYCVSTCGTVTSSGWTSGC